MADQQLALPIRTEADGLDQRVQVKIVDKTAPGTQQMAVDLDSNAHVEVHGNAPDGTDRVVALDTLGRTRVVVEEDSDGAAVHDYKTDAAVAAAASANHDYAVTATKTLHLKRARATASGKLKLELQVGPVGGPFVTKAVGFNSVANPDINIDFPEPIRVAAPNVVRLIRTNRDNQAMDLYSTINGEER